MKLKRIGPIVALLFGLLIFSCVNIFGQDTTQSSLNSAAIQPGGQSVAPVEINSKATSSQILCSLLIGTPLGAAGQIARATVGIKNEMDAATAAVPPKKWGDWFNTSQFVVSILLGAVAGLVASITIIGTENDKTFLLGCVAAGYSGSDFIEGFMSKQLPK